MNRLGKWILSLSLILALAPSLSRASDEQIPEVEIKNIKSETDQYVTVMYAQANRSMFSTDDRDLKVKEVRVSKTFGPGKMESVVIDSVQLSRDGFGGSFNCVVVVFHAQPEFNWTNADGSEVKYPNSVKISAGHSLQTYTKVFNRSQIPQLSSRGNKSGRVTLFLPN